MDVTDIFDIAYRLRLKKPQPFEKMDLYICLQVESTEEEVTLVGPSEQSVSTILSRAQW